MAEIARASQNRPTNFWTRLYTQLNTAASSSAVTIFAILGAFPSYISRRLNAAASTLRCYIFHFIQVQFISSFNQSIALIIPLLTTFVQLKYQLGNDQKKTLFVTHPRTMRLAVSSSVAYYIAYISLLRFRMRSFAVVAHHCLVWSGYASVASLASLLFPDSRSPFVYAIFVLLSAAELLYCLYHRLVVVVEEEEGADFQAYRRRVGRFLNNICRVVANSPAQRPQILPF